GCFWRELMVTTDGVAGGGSTWTGSGVLAMPTFPARSAASTRSHTRGGRPAGSRQRYRPVFSSWQVIGNQVPPGSWAQGRAIGWGPRFLSDAFPSTVRGG